ncbi:MAG: 2-oxo acid dehydrogenase subunit E2 [Bacilli bacterium]|nr:2-oxo acid dehydrogenase subunit E2 [Bacilli bacterium]
MSRNSGYKVKDVTGMQNIMFDLMPRRSDSEVYMNNKIDVTEFVKFIKKEQRKNKDLTYFHGFLAILGKTLYKYPSLNRYVQNRTLFMHYDVTLGFVAKAEFNEKSEEFMACLKINKDDNIYKISDNIKKKIDDIRDTSKRHTDGANDIIDKVGHLWRPFRSLIVGFLKWVDKKFELPKSFADENIYYTSLMVSNLGTFKTGAIYHHLTELGTCSGIITFGEIKEENKRYYMEMGLTMDERIADGFLFCKAMKSIEYLFNNPEILKEDVNKDFEEK